MKRKKIINNKNLNSLFKIKSSQKLIKSKAKSTNNDINNNENIHFQNHNINGNYKSIYYFDDEIFDKENDFNKNNRSIKHSFIFSEIENENKINKSKTSRKEKKINNNISNLNENNLTLNIDNTYEQNKMESYNNENINGFNNSYKIINESKYNNKSKVTIYLISDKNYNYANNNTIV